MRERSTDWLPPTQAWTRTCARTQTEDRNCSLGVCSDREPNLQSFSYRTPLQPGRKGQGQMNFLVLFLTTLCFMRGLRAA